MTPRTSSFAGPIHFACYIYATGLGAKRSFFNYVDKRRLADGPKMCFLVISYKVENVKVGG